MRFIILVFALVWASLSYLGETQDLTDPEVIQMITDLKAGVPDCAVNIRHFSNLELRLT